jgi:hypothetical protein
MPLAHFNAETFRSSQSPVTFTYTKNTSSVQITTAAAHADTVEDQFQLIISAYTVYVRRGEVSALPTGAQIWAQAFYGDHRSEYVLAAESEPGQGEDYLLTAGRAHAKAASRPAAHIPTETAYHEAIDQLLDEVHSLLGPWPSFQRQLELHLINEYGATPPVTVIDEFHLEGHTPRTEETEGADEHMAPNRRNRSRRPAAA